MVDIHDIAHLETQPDGTQKMVWGTIYLPEGKTPFVLSQDDVSYYEYMEGDGFANRLVIDENGSIPHDIYGKFGSASVLLKKSPEGTGIIAGGPARSVLELAGVKNIRTKSLGSNNKQNVVMATMEGLNCLKTPEEVAKNRGKSVEEILG